MDSLLEYVRNVLTRTPGTEVVDLRTGSGCDDGNNIAGDLVKITATVKLDGQQNVVNFICKSSGAPWQNDQSDFVQRFQVFSKEAGFFCQVLPKLTLFQETLGVKAVKVHIPKCIDAVTGVLGAHDRVLLQDMSVFGYKMVDKKKNLTHDEILLAMSEIAKLHAISYAYKVTKNVTLADEFPAVKDCVFCPDEKLFTKYMTHAHYQEAILYMEELDKKDIADRLKKFSSVEYEIIQPVLATSPNDPYHVICHGDFWKNNLLFQYDANEKPTRCCLIDFQQVRPTSLMYDIIYFIYTSTTRRQRQKHLMHWLEHHYTKFISTISYLKVRPAKEFTYECYQTKFYQSLPYGLIYMCFAFVFQQSDEEALMALMNDPFPCLKLRHDGSGYHDVTDAVKKCFRSGNVKDKLLEIFQDMIDFGVI